MKYKITQNESRERELEKKRIVLFLKTRIRLCEILLYIYNNYENNPVTNKELSKKLLCDRTTVIRTIDILKELYLIESLTIVEAIPVPEGRPIVTKHDRLLRGLKGGARKLMEKTQYYIITKKGEEWIPFCCEQLGNKCEVQNVHNVK